MTGFVRFQFAVYFPEHQNREPQLVARGILAKSYPEFRIVNKLPAEPASATVSIHVEDNVAKSYAPPTLEALRYSGHGRDARQSQSLQKTRRALLLDFSHPTQQVWSALHQANSLTEAVARQIGGFVWDEETREVFTADAWHASRVGSWTDSETVPEVSHQTVIHLYQKDEFIRAITLGMRKFGLPDVVVEGSSRHTEDQVGILINLFCQTMAEGASLDIPGKFNLDLNNIRNAEARDRQSKSLKAFAEGAVVLTLNKGRHDDGDPDNRLIQVGSDAYRGPDPHAKLDAMLTCFFGSEDKARPVEHTDELLEASRKAKEQLPALRELFKTGLQPGEVIMVKAPFATQDGGREWMWVEVTRWQENHIQGLLQNDPAQVHDLHAGPRFS
jgi:hypothetical protein